MLRPKSSHLSIQRRPHRISIPGINPRTSTFPLVLGEPKPSGSDRDPDHTSHTCARFASVCVCSQPQGFAPRMSPLHHSVVANQAGPILPWASSTQASSLCRSDHSSIRASRSSRECMTATSASDHRSPCTRPSEEARQLSTRDNHLTKHCMFLCEAPRLHPVNRTTRSCVSTTTSKLADSTHARRRCLSHKGKTQNHKGIYVHARTQQRPWTHPQHAGSAA